MTSVSDGHIILTLTQPAGNRPPERGSNPQPPNRKLSAALTEACAINMAKKKIKKLSLIYWIVLQV